MLTNQISNFNPRTPCGVRRFAADLSKITAPFQSTHPLRGATVDSFGYSYTLQFQSTHPLRGATRSRRPFSTRIRHFNPRTPCGVRHIILVFLSLLILFQSTHPLRGATSPQGSRSIARSISIHAPLAGCDLNLIIRIKNLHHFNPRTPCGVRQHYNEH